MHRERGVTLIELAVTLTVLAICTAVGVPAMRAFTQQQRVVAAMGSLTTHLANARMAAVTRNQPVVLCPIEPAADACVQDADWSRGWLVFFDSDRDERVGLGDEVLAIEREPAGGHLRVMTTSGRDHVRYLPDGRSAGTNVTFTLCDTDGHLLGRVIVNNAGRARTERPGGPAPCS